MYSLIVVTEAPTAHAYTVSGEEEAMRELFNRLTDAGPRATPDIRYVAIINERGEMFNEYSKLAGEA